MAFSWLACAVVFLFLGLPLLLLGWRGRRVGDHPYCRRCRFDLFGLDAPPACPECGQALADRAGTSLPDRIVIGQRKIRPVLLVSGLVLTLVPLALAVTVLGLRVAQLDPYDYAPAWWLRGEAAAAFTAQDAARFDRAMDELRDRLTQGQLSPSALAATADAALDAQADRATPWLPAWGDFIEEAMAAQLLNPPRIERYYQQAAAEPMRLDVRPRVTRGDPIPYRLADQPLRVGESFRLWLQNDAQNVVIVLDPDGLNLPVRSGMSGGGTAGLHGGGSSSSSLRLNDEQWEQLEPGVYTVAMSIDYGVHEYGYPGGKGQLVTRVTLDQTAGFEVVPADTPTVRAVVDDALRQQVRASVTADEVRYRHQPNHGDPRVEGTIRMNAPPVGLAMKVWVEAENPDDPAGPPLRWECNNVDTHANHTTNYHFSFRWRSRDEPPHTPLPEGTRAIDIILEPNRDAAIGDVDIVDYWDETIRLDDVPIQWDPPVSTPPSGSASQGSIQPPTTP